MSTISVEATEPLTFDRTPPLSEMYLLSPCVWREEDAYHVLLRAVNHADNPANKIARIYHGPSDDGLRFRLDALPTLAPSLDLGADDADGCEDPSLVLDGGRYRVYYSGWNQGLRRGHLLRAVGADMATLRKRGRVLPHSAQQKNPKEAELVRSLAGGWRLFFEYAEDGHSKVGLARADNLEGQWRSAPDPFAARPDCFDSWHLSAGPVIKDRAGQPVMLYNGATRQGQWRVGWIAFDDAFTHVLDRCDGPLITPPRPHGDATDIAFAASALQEGDTVLLYFTISDDQPTRALLRLG